MPNQWQHLVETLESAPIIYDLDVVRIDQTLNPRLNEKILREGLRIYPESSATQLASVDPPTMEAPACPSLGGFL